MLTSPRIGFPGWLTRVPRYSRTNNTHYLNSTQNYASHINAIIAKAQITNGGPVILYQPENEYSTADPPVKFPDTSYMAAVEKQTRDAGIVVPFISNDNAPHGYFTPGSGQGEVDIYGYDGYPLGFDCANPYTWPDGALPTNFEKLHLQQSPSTPNSIVEFQGGSFDPWGGLGFAQCEKLLNHEFERVFYKNDFSFGVTILNLYMTYGGTNWGGISHPGGYTSYDYGAVLSEDRLVTREKYSEAKLEANFLMASPAYLTALPLDNTNANGSYSDNSAIAITQLQGMKSRFFVTRHAAYSSFNSTSYKLYVPSSAGNLALPRFGGSLSLHGRDSKIHVVDCAVGDFHLLYSTAEIFTWKVSNAKTTLVVYGGPDEQHELAFTNVPAPKLVEGNGVHFDHSNGSRTLNWKVSSTRRIVNFGNTLTVYILDRNSAYNYWVLPTTSNKFWKGTKAEETGLLARAGYLLRLADLDSTGSTLSLTGDLNATTPLEIISGAPKTVKSLRFNGKDLNFTRNSQGVITATLPYRKPDFRLPTLGDLEWRYIDSLPEVQAKYDDSQWPSANLQRTANDEYTQNTPTSLFASDYGFNTGSLLFRGHFEATGSERSVFLRPYGGYAFGASAWLNETFLGSCPGIDAAEDCNVTFPISVQTSKSYVLTVLQDHMGLTEQYNPGRTQLKLPRGLVNYGLDGRPQSAVSWKITGNLGGEAYVDKTRGPLNEGGLFAERQGYHYPQAPTAAWARGSPLDGFHAAGVRFYYAQFDLNLPTGYDIPLSFTFGNRTVTNATRNYRAQLYVNGYQFGKFVHNIGPQTSFPVPQGILDHCGPNYLGLSLWALDEHGAKIESLELTSAACVQTGFGTVGLSPAPAYMKRVGAY